MLISRYNSFCFLALNSLTYTYRYMYTSTYTYGCVYVRMDVCMYVYEIAHNGLLF
jgi:uncharacterized membrane protein